jgi:hypothetical protein
MTAITGKEDQGDLSTPYQALIQFYYAFNEGDFETMSANWLQTDEIAMDNPLGGIKPQRCTLNITTIAFMNPLTRFMQSAVNADTFGLEKSKSNWPSEQVAYTSGWIMAGSKCIIMDL